MTGPKTLEEAREWKERTRSLAASLSNAWIEGFPLLRKKLEQEGKLKAHQERLAELREEYRKNPEFQEVKDSEK